MRCRRESAPRETLCYSLNNKALPSKPVDYPILKESHMNSNKPKFRVFWGCKKGSVGEGDECSNKATRTS